jgi:hypothetical protein
MQALHTDPAKVAKQILPSGFTDYTFGGAPNFGWRKKHGHAGRAMIDRAVEKAKKIGFKEGKYGTHGTPDGSAMGSSGVLYHPDGWELGHYASYGCVAYDNIFSMSLKKVEIANFI